MNRNEVQKRSNAMNELLPQILKLAKEKGFQYNKEDLFHQHFKSMTECFVHNPGIDAGTHLEEAIRIFNNLDFCPTGNGQDFTDGSDAKFVNATLSQNDSLRKNSWQLSALIPADNKIGNLRVVVFFTNEQTNTTDFKFINVSANGSKMVKITLNKDNYEVQNRKGRSNVIVEQTLQEFFNFN